jgi:hypothetical protein
MTTRNHSAEVDTAKNAVDIKTTIKKNEWGEWVVRLFEDGELVATYHTNDRADADETSKAMLKEATAKQRTSDRASILHRRNAVRALWAIYQEANLSDGDYYTGEYPSHAAGSVCCPLEKAMRAMGVDVDLSCHNGELTFKSDSLGKGGEA